MRAGKLSPTRRDFEFSPRNILLSTSSAEIFSFLSPCLPSHSHHVVGPACWLLCTEEVVVVVAIRPVKNILCLCSFQISSRIRDTIGHRGMSRRRHLWQRVVTHPMLHCLFLPFFFSLSTLLQHCLLACMAWLMGPSPKFFLHQRKHFSCLSHTDTVLFFTGNVWLFQFV
jgi:hypothetical protein